MTGTLIAIVGLTLSTAFGFLLWEHAQGPRKDVWEAGAYAFPVGGASTAVLALAFAHLGVPVARWPLLLGLAAGTGAAWAFRAPSPRAAVRASASRGGVLAAIGATLIGVQLLLVVVPIAQCPVIADWDAWAIWGIKAKAFFVDQGVSGYLRRSDALDFSWPARPCLTSLQQAFLYACLGRVDEGAARVMHVLWYVSLLAAFYGGLRRICAPAPAALGTAGLATVPNLTYLASAGLANLALGALLFLAVLALDRWRRGQGWPTLLGAGGLFGAALLTRDEALLLAPLVAGVFLLALVERGLPVRRALAAALGLAPVALALYSLWAAFTWHHTGFDIKGAWLEGGPLQRARLHLKDADVVLGMVVRELVDPAEQTRASPLEEWLGVALFWPLFGTAVVALVAARRRPPLAYGAAMASAAGLVLFALGLWLFDYQDLDDLRNNWAFVLDRHLAALVPTAGFSIAAAAARGR